jgi:cytochrome c oxidase subunit 6b
MADTKSNIVLATAGFDARFPNSNQTKRCWQNYADYYRCIAVLGEGKQECQQFYRAFRSLCPDEWVSESR